MIPTKTLQQELDIAKSEYTGRVKEIKWRHNYESLTLEEKVKIMTSKRGDELMRGKKVREKAWNMLNREERIPATKLILGKAHTAKADVREYSALFLAPRISLSDYMYKVEVFVFDRCTLQIVEGLKTRPTPEQVLKYVQSVIPNIKAI